MKKTRNLIVLMERKKAMSLIGLVASTISLFCLLPYLPATLFSTLFVVLSMVALTLWAHVLYRPASARPLLTEEELEDWDNMLEEEIEGEAVSDNKVELVSDGMVDIIHGMKKTQEVQGERAPKRLHVQELNKARALANKKKKRKKRKRLAKYSKRVNR